MIETFSSPFSEFMCYNNCANDNRFEDKSSVFYTSSK